MAHRFSFSFYLLCFIALSASAQNVGIGISVPAQKLHIGGNTNTLRLEGVSSSLAGTHIVLPALSTDKIVYVNNNGDFKAIPGGVAGQTLTLNSSGVPIWTTSSSNDWTLIGNAGTVPGTNFIGTTDAQAFIIKTGGSASTNERLRFLSTGPIVQNKTTTVSGDVFSVYGSGYTGAINALGAFAINGYVGANGIGVYGETNASSGTNTGIGVLGSVQGVNAGALFANYGVYGENITVPNATGFSIGVEGVASSATGNARGVEGVSSSTSGFGVTAFNTSASLTTNTAHGLYAQTSGTVTSGFAIGARGVSAATSGSTIYGVYGQSASDDGVAVLGFGNTGAGVIGAGESAYGIYGQIDGTVSGTGVAIAIVGLPNAATLVTGDVRGVSGQSNSTTGVGVIGFATNTANTGAGIQGQNSGLGDAIRGISTAAAASAASGVYGETPSSGLFAALEGYGTNAAGTGGAFYGDNTATINFIAGGSGSSSTGSIAGTAGWSTSNAANTLRYGGYFDTNAGTSYSYVGAITAANVNRKVEGNGTVNTVVSDLNGNKVVLSAPEAPENLFMDFGQGQLVNGKTTITMDATFSKNIIVNEIHPLRVIIQLEGNCNGVYVANKTQNGFEVIELLNGQSNVAFTYFVTANRADEVNADGTVAKYSEERFAPAIGATQAISRPAIVAFRKPFQAITKMEPQASEIILPSFNQNPATPLKTKLFR